MAASSGLCGNSVGNRRELNRAACGSFTGGYDDVVASGTFLSRHLTRIWIPVWQGRVTARVCRWIIAGIHLGDIRNVDIAVCRFLQILSREMDIESGDRISFVATGADAPWLRIRPSRIRSQCARSQHCEAKVGTRTHEVSSLKPGTVTPWRSFSVGFGVRQKSMRGSATTQVAIFG